MKSIEEIRAIPKIRLFMPNEQSGVARFKLLSTKHTQLVRIVFTWFNGMDVVQIMFKQNKRPTEAEIEEVLNLFFHESEKRDCIIMQHPYNELIAMICRPQGGYANV